MCCDSSFIKCLRLRQKCFLTTLVPSALKNPVSTFKTFLLLRVHCPHRPLKMLHHPLKGLFWLLRKRDIKLRAAMSCFIPTLLPPHGQDIKVTMETPQKRGHSALKYHIFLLEEKLLFYTYLIGKIPGTRLLPNPTQRAKEKPWVNKNCKCMLKHKLQWREFKLT